MSSLARPMEQPQSLVFVSICTYVLRGRGSALVIPYLDFLLLGGRGSHDWSSFGGFLPEGRGEVERDVLGARVARWETGLRRVLEIEVRLSGRDWLGEMPALARGEEVEA